VANNSGGAFNVGTAANAAYVNFMQAVANNAEASFTITNSTVNFEAGVTNNGTWITDPSTVIFNGAFTSTGSFSASSTDTYEFLGPAGTIDAINLGGKTVTIATLDLESGVTLDVTDGTLIATSLFDSTGTNPHIPNVTGASYGIFNPVPVPGALWLLAPGLAALAGIRRRIRK
jgi:hypothetical protein